MKRLFAAIFLTATVLASVAAAQSGPRAERRDPLFLRFPEMAERYWVNTETNAASHKVVAVPLPRQCAFVYADSYSRGQMSESEVQQMALSSCNRKLSDLGPLNENYSALIGRDRSVTFTVDNPRGEQVCEGTFTNDGPATGRFSMSCFAGKFRG